jgi:phosphatidate cytidylyltransferase
LPGGRLKELYTRVAIALIGIPIFVAAIWFGKVYFALLIATFALVGTYELFTMAEVLDYRPQKWLGYIGVVAVAYLFLHHSILMVTLLLMLLTLTALMAEMFALKEKPLANTAVTLFSLFYSGLFFSSLIGIRESAVFGDYESAGIFLILLFTGVWICDTVAYFYGTKFGKRKLFHEVSPNKSIEGSVAGFVGSLLIFLIVFFLELLPGFQLYHALILSVLTGIFGQIGDLIESWLKRTAQIKDSSSIIPGHGGVLDRFDSMIIVAPLTYVLIQINIL